MLERFQRFNDTAAFNRWAGIEVVRAVEGEVELRLPWREDLGQYAGFLHAALIGGLIDTACGFAAATVSGPVLASHFAVNCMAPAVGSAFVVRGRVVKAGRKQVFTTAELLAETPSGLKLVATGNAILVPVEAAAPAGGKPA
jgi:uncharacterized protein (TIGR00369 family)